MWQTDFTFLKIVNWGWYYLSTTLDDHSRKIIIWRLCTQMTADEMTKTLVAAIEETGVSPDRFVRMPRLLSDNGPCYISKELKDYLKGRDLPCSRGQPFHP